MSSDQVHLGHRARKRFGQNFLNDPYIIDGIVSAINPKPGQNLVEIGPGLGAITEPVGKLVDKFSVIELDRDLAERLRNHPELGSKLTIYEGDAMRFDFTQLIKENNKLRIFGNLPYNISTPLMFHLFSFHEHVQDMHFMLQKEVVNRLAAGPGSKGLRPSDRHGTVLLQGATGAGSAAIGLQAGTESRLRRRAPDPL